MIRWRGRPFGGLIKVDVIVGGPLGFSTIRIQPAWRRGGQSAARPTEPHSRSGEPSRPPHSPQS
jgi:hypothetical protein